VKASTHCLLLGNGLNRLSRQLEWSKLLDRLEQELGIDGRVEHFDDKPLSLLFEELCAYVGGSFRDTERSIKKKIANILKDVQPQALHTAYLERFDVVLTTNYDYTLENAHCSPLLDRIPVAPETRYSLFRRVRIGPREIWHIHGDIHVPESILLGYDHYSGYLQKIRNYLTSGLKLAGRTDLLRSPLKSGNQSTEQCELKYYSWVDYFLRDHVHIVGLGLDFTEIDLWWLLLHKRRRRTQTGYTFYYHIRINGVETKRDVPRLSVLRSLGMNVVGIDASSYREGYERVLDEVSRNIEANPQRRAADASPCDDDEAQSLDALLTEDPVPEKPKQRELRLEAKGKKSRSGR